MTIDQRLVDAFYQAALFLESMIRHPDPAKRWRTVSSNYLREHVRCRFALKFTNSISPLVLDEVIRQHPELYWIKVNKHKPAGYDYVTEIAKRLVPHTNGKRKQ